MPSCKHLNNRLQALILTGIHVKKCMRPDQMRPNVKFMIPAASLVIAGLRENVESLTVDQPFYQQCAGDD
ncbi:uncharacterized protein BDCG_08959 [Blastomyces dermatitidis ER-3]|uniref:Uncharacterized protein n=1 Tax=Ajellomyces dermatitidis (strain ER-3 / ATCC MYA-2586) TaxID=559297 RepID=A0ABP2EQ36_AJEDR|nr:uncharacterized protein BDCG_08959 [Blastomyces dermatitidis ER-3]EEQ85690.2 hypothetical protein BDCG_08959 [Blastomyces dermatitidis ER-3]